MLRYIVGRMFSMVPALLLVSAVVFVVMRLLPGDPAVAMLGQAEASAETLARMRQEMGLDQPIPVQYALWISRVAQGDLGISVRSRVPVSVLLIQRLPVTTQLAGMSLLLGIVIAMVSAMLAASRRGTWLDQCLTGGSLAGLSMPGFVLALGMIYLFALRWRWLPPTGYVGFLEDPIQNLRLMVMPTVSLGLASAGLMMRLLRSQLLEEFGRDYVRTARAKGLVSKMVVGHHVLRNALIPFVTIVGQQAGVLLSGAVITETVFALPGMGRLIVDNVLNRDLAVVEGVVLLSAIFYLAVSLAVDLLYAVIDPQIRLT